MSRIWIPAQSFGWASSREDGYAAYAAGITETVTLLIRSYVPPQRNRGWLICCNIWVFASLHGCIRAILCGSQKDAELCYSAVESLTKTPMYI